MKTKIVLLILFAASLAMTNFTALNAQTIHYVKADGTGNGTSWNDAAGNIQDMIDNASSGDELWVAAGIYYPVKQTSETDIQSKTFLLKDGVHLYGGFAGNETDIDSRAQSDMDGNGTVDAWEFTNETILSGNIDDIPDVWEWEKDSWGWSVSNNSGNSNKVVTCPVEVANETVLDGFTVSGGNKGGLYTYGNTRIQNCIIAFNDGGYGINNDIGTVSNCYIYHNSYTGLFNNKGIVSNCTIDSNIKYVNIIYTVGGGVINMEGEITNCKVINNGVILYYGSNSSVSSEANGGGIYNSKGKIERCLVMHNSVSSYRATSSGQAGLVVANAYGGGIYNTNNGTISNCCIYNNEANAYVIGGGSFLSVGGGVYTVSGAAVYNTTVINNRADNLISNLNGSYSDSYNCITTGNTIEQNFIRPTSFAGLATTEQQTEEVLQADWRLKSGSQYIDAGSMENLPDWVINSTDLAGNPRINNGTIDVGAYEYYEGQGSGINPLTRPEGITVFSNPATGYLTISGLQGGDTLRFFDLYGRLLFTQVAENESETVAVGHLPKGAYLLRVNNQSIKFIKN
jgi:hypothetical protein